MFPYILEPDTLFRGRYLLPYWLKSYQCETLALIGEHGQEKVWKVYDWVFKYMQSIKWGQWIVVEKIAPDAKARRLLYWCMELIYQSSLVCDFRVVREDGETRVVSVEPDPAKKERNSIFMSADGYLLTDWYGRLRQDPLCDPDIKPEWLGLQASDNSGSDETATISSESSEDLPDD